MADVGKASPADRIVSVLRFHGLLFDSDEYEPLLDFDRDRRRDKLVQVLSVLRAHAILHQDGYLRRDEESAGDISAMIRYLNGLLEDAPPEVKKIGMIPRHLGSSFVRSGFGFPLFGYYRPEATPEEDGILLAYHSPDADGSARFEGERKTGSTRLEYLDLGVRAESEEPRMYCVVSPQDQAPLLVPSAAFDRPEPEVFDYSRYIVTMAAGPVAAGARSRVLDPQSYQFAYFFPDQPRMGLNLSRFLKDVFSGRFGVPPADAENLGRGFSERLLGR